MSEEIYKLKYLKYKAKYLKLLGGTIRKKIKAELPVPSDSDDEAPPPPPGTLRRTVTQARGINYREFIDKIYNDLIFLITNDRDLQRADIIVQEFKSKSDQVGFRFTKMHKEIGHVTLHEPIPGSNPNRRVRSWHYKDCENNRDGTCDHFRVWNMTILEEDNIIIKGEFIKQGEYTPSSDTQLIINKLNYFFNQAVQIK